MTLFLLRVVDLFLFLFRLLFHFLVLLFVLLIILQQLQKQKCSWCEQQKLCYKKCMPCNKYFCCRCKIFYINQARYCEKQHPLKAAKQLKICYLCYRQNTQQQQQYQQQQQQQQPHFCQDSECKVMLCKSCIEYSRSMDSYNRRKRQVENRKCMYDDTHVLFFRRFDQFNNCSYCHEYKKIKQSCCMCKPTKIFCCKCIPPNSITQCYCGKDLKQLKMQSQQDNFKFDFDFEQCMICSQLWSQTLYYCLACNYNICKTCYSQPMKEEQQMKKLQEGIEKLANEKE